MLVRSQDLAKIERELANTAVYSLDTETTGLRPYNGDRLFSVIIASQTEVWYFNLQKYPGIPDDIVLTPAELRGVLSAALQNTESMWFMHNAKFDLAFLRKEGLEVCGTVHCTEAVARLIDNTKFSYSLDALCKDIGLSKSNAVEEYIKEHKLYSKRKIAGKKKQHTDKYFHKVPLRIIHEYGEQDARITHRLGCHQIERLEEIANTHIRNSRGNNILHVYENELALTKVLSKMENVGIHIDKDYSTQALSHEQSQADIAAAKFSDLSGKEFSDSNKPLAEAFTAAGETYPTTEKGNPSFTDDVLEGMTSPLATYLRQYRGSSKRASTYFSSFLSFCDNENIVHTNIRQGGTDTGRVSSSDPNLQNLHKRDESEFPVRRAFTPRPGYCFVMIDYDQMEYRLMLEYAREQGLIDRIKNDGLDVHQATANMLQISRDHAKTLNFMLLYGGGVGKLAAALGIPFEQARAIRQKYFNGLPEVTALIRRVMKVAEQRGQIVNWLGRICLFSDPNFCYKAPNYLIQGGTADIVKTAIVRLDKFLLGKRSRMLMQIHDEILFEIHESELSIVPMLRSIMEGAFVADLLPLTCEVSHSWKSWHDKVKGEPREMRKMQNAHVSQQHTACA